jgi:hypothetical protein
VEGTTAPRNQQPDRSNTRKYASIGCVVLALFFACGLFWLLGQFANEVGNANTTTANRQPPISIAGPTPAPPNTPERALVVPAGFKPVYKFLRAEDSSISDRNTLEPIKRKTISITLPDGLDRQTVELNLKHAAHDLYEKEKPHALIVYGYREGETGASPYSVGMLTYAPYGDWGRAGEKPPPDKYQAVVEIKDSYLNPDSDAGAESEAAGLEKKALAGDYQAQRNLAYYLITGEEGVKADHVMACAWRIVILKSGHSQADASDTSNKQFDCDRKLTPAQLRQAESQATSLLKRIRK